MAVFNQDPYNSTTIPGNMNCWLEKQLLQI